MIAPTNPSRGDRWNEIDSNKDLVEEWFWNGTNWLGRDTIPRDTLLISGQTLSLSNAIVGVIGTNTDEVPFSINANYGIYVTKIYAALKIPAGNLSATNYWSLLLKNGAVTLQTLNITSGDDAATTGDVRKSSTSINTSYPKAGKYSFSLVQTGLPPSLRSPSALIEYRLVR